MVLFLKVKVKVIGRVRTEHDGMTVVIAKRWYSGVFVSNGNM